MQNELQVFAFWDRWTKAQYFVAFAIGVLGLIGTVAAIRVDGLTDVNLFFGVATTALIISIVIMAIQRSRRRIEVEGDRIRFFTGRRLVVDVSLSDIIQMRSLILINGDIERWILDFPDEKRIDFDPNIDKPYELALHISTYVGIGFERIPSSTGVGTTV